MTDLGGEVHFMITKGANKYDAVSRWGISGEALAGSNRGMKFLGDKKKILVITLKKYMILPIFSLIGK